MTSKANKSIKIKLSLIKYLLIKIIMKNVLIIIIKLILIISNKNKYPKIYFLNKIKNQKERKFKNNNPIIRNNQVQ